MSRFIAEAFQHMRISARKVPKIAWRNIVRFSLPRGINNGRAHTSIDDKGPFRRRGMPVKLTHHTRLALHGLTGNSIRDQQLLDRYFFSERVAKDSPFRL